MHSVVNSHIREADFCCPLDLDRLCNRAFLNCELARSAKAPLIIQLFRSKATVKLRSSGEAFFSGTCSVEQARTALKKVARRCKVLSWPVKFKHFKVRLVRWLEPYRPEFPIDILALGRHSSAEIRQNSSSQPLRVLLPCVAVGASGPRAEGSFQLEDDQDVPADAGVWAEISADGRTRFHGALAVEELHQALDAIVPILEDHRLEGMVDARDARDDAGQDRERHAQRRGLGIQKAEKRRGSAPLSREALELEEPLPRGLMVVPKWASPAAALPFGAPLKDMQIKEDE